MEIKKILKKWIPYACGVGEDSIFPLVKPMNDIWAIGDRPNKVRADDIRPYDSLSQIYTHAM